MQEIHSSCYNSRIGRGGKDREGDRESDFDSLVHLVTQASRFSGRREDLWKQEKKTVANIKAST